MSRRFKSFLDAYCEYAADDFCPPQFAEWCALSVVAAALERRVWLPWNQKYTFFPNIYVLLVSHPGQGKSVSLDAAVDVLKAVSRKTGTINIMPAQVTEAKFIELMGHGRSFMHKWTEESLDEAGTKVLTPKEMTYFQNAAFYYASEASATLKNIFGDFIACLTNFYDCPSAWSRATKKDGKPIVLQNVCMNMLAASTFDYLGKIVSDENIQGGFASRVIYVQQLEDKIRVQKFQSGLDADSRKEYANYQAALVEDLTAISKLIGPMHATPEYGAAWEAWYPEQQRSLLNKEERMRSILTRTNTNVFKVSMLLSAAESDDRTLKLHHLERAIQLVEGVNAHVPRIFIESKAAQGPRGRAGDALANAIKSKLLRATRVKGDLCRELTMQGYSPRNIDETLDALIRSNFITEGPAIAGDGGSRLKIVAEA